VRGGAVRVGGGAVRVGGAGVAAGLVFGAGLVGHSVPPGLVGSAPAADSESIPRPRDLRKSRPQTWLTGG